MSRVSYTAAASLAAFVAAAAACSDSTGPGGRNMTLSFSTQPAVGAQMARFSSSPSFDVVVGGASDSLVITRARIVLREVELESSLGSCAAADDSAAVDGEDCEELELGPMLVDLPLTAGAVTSPVSVAIPAGSYHEIEFDLHKPSDGDARDIGFTAANPDFRDVSVRVEGTYKGQPFVFTSAVNTEVELEFSPALVVDAAGANATIQVDVARWFRDAAGAVIAPTEANKSRIEGNIYASFRAIEDDDRDGQDD